MRARHLPALGRRVPTSTYRLQLGPDLSFDDVLERLDHVVSLGITDLYLSPVLAAAPGSTHGYDVVDHRRISDVMGGREAFERLADAAHARGLGIVVDVVPNHMAVPTPVWHNRALWSVLAHGPDSPFAAWFDVDWSSHQRVLMPILGRRIGAAIGAGEITVESMVVPGQGEAEQRVLRYFDHVFPIRTGTESLPVAELVDRQHYRLAYWRVADEELNYRRFFDVGSLAAIRVEDPAVFAESHALLLELYEQGRIDAFRIDHPDGLADPRGYHARLAEATGSAWVVAEKILEGDEEVPPDWAVAGTTGYDALWRIGSLFVDPAGASELGALMQRLTGDARGDFAALVDAAKRQVIAGPLHAEVHRLTTLLADICQDDVRLRDHTWRAIRDCIIELLVAFDRYRAYVVPGELASTANERVMAHAADRARHALEGDRVETLRVVVDLLLGREAGSAGRKREARRDEAVVRFQQVCGPVMAKGVEDTAFYRWTHLVSLCEVGGSPQRFGLGTDELHAWARTSQTTTPDTMTTLSTHDTKRGEDVRARIGVLSEYAAEWSELVDALREATAAHRPAALDGRTENLLWQTLAGTWTEAGPIAADRLAAYLVKAAREAKMWTAWTAPDTAAEEALTGYAEHLLTDKTVRTAFEAWVRRTAGAVRAAVLGSKLVQLTLPGVADVYQGTETLGVALVDPDNRRPVDAAALAARLRRLDAGATPSTPADEKLALTAAALRLRRRCPGAFIGATSGYTPLPTSTGHAVAFARTEAGTARAVTIATRLTVALAGKGGWGDHTVVLPPGRWRDVLAGPHSPEVEGGAQSLRRLLTARPVVLLEAR